MNLNLIFKISLVISGLFPLVSESRAIEFISQERVSSLQLRFNEAQPLDLLGVQKISGRDLNCTMYGLKTRLQVERNIQLYRFQVEGSQVDNKGTHVISSYKIENSEFVGSTEGLQEIVRVDKNKKSLIGRLSRRGPSDSAGIRNDLAIIECPI